MEISPDILNSLNQEITPLNTLYFSDYNMRLVHQGIRQKFKELTGKSIDYQNHADVVSIMRYVFIMNSTNPYNDMSTQVDMMNKRSIDMAVKQIKTGFAQFMGYVKDINSPIVPNALPENTSLYGKKIDKVLKM
jgi:hypothetical protein